MSFSIQDSNSDLLFVGFNQDNGCFACGTKRGFSIYNCDPYRETFKRDFPSGGIGIVAMLYRCNLLGLVGGGSQPCFPPNKVILWDDHQAQCIGELTFKSEVKAVKLRRDKIVVVLENQIYIYNFDKLENLFKYETASNPKGLSALSPSTDSCVIAFPSVQKGIVRVLKFDGDQQKKDLFVTAHDSGLSCITLNLDGSRLATASEKGTLVRIFDTETGDRLQEVRRGADKAEIYSISFSHNSHLLCVSSDKGTIHVFSVNQSKSEKKIESESVAENEIEPQNRTSKLSFIGSVASYFGSEWSFAWYKGPECPSICAFTPDNSVVVVSSNGNFTKLQFDPKKGGECKVKNKVQFFKNSK